MVVRCQLPDQLASSVGTTVEVRRLFFNTPARRKFLKSDGAETTRVREVVQRLAAAHHDIAFTLKSGVKMLLEYPKTTTKERILAIFGGELEREMLELDGSADGVALWGSRWNSECCSTQFKVYSCACERKGNQ